MAAPPPASERVRTVAYRDGLGERVVAADALTGGVVQVLQLSPALVGSGMFEFALRERILRLGKFRHASYLPAHRVDRLQGSSPGLALVSAHVQGIRLSQLLRTADDRGVRLDITTALEVIRQLLPPIALLHEFAPDIACGLLGPERLIVSSNGQVTIAEQPLAGAIEQLRFDRDRLWRELRVPVLSGPKPARFSHRSDVMSLGLVALALLLGRPLAAQDFPDGLVGLLDTARERSTIDDDRPLSAPLRDWLERALQLDPARSFASISEAWVVFSKILATETAYRTAPVTLDTFLYNCTVALLQPVLEEAYPRPSTPHPEPPRPDAPDAAQNPEIHVEMLPPPSLGGDLTPLSMPAGEIDWSAASEQLSAVVSSRDISELLADVDDPAAQSGGPTPEPARASLFDQWDDASDTANEDTAPTVRSATSLEVDADARLSRLTRRLASLTPSSRLSRTAMATALVTLLAVSVVWASLRAPAVRTPDQGTLVVETSPEGLQVLIDGIEQGQSPARLRVPAGDHLLEVRGDTGARVVPVTVSGGAEVSQYIELQATTPETESRVPESSVTPTAPGVATVGTPAPNGAKAPATIPPAEASAAEVPTFGWVAVKGPFPVEIRTGDKTVGAAGTERVRMAVGRHEIELVNDAQAYRASRVVHVVAGKVTNVFVEKPPTGTVNLNASPWAEVWIGGRRIGETPLANVTLNAGRHEVVFRHPELGEKREEISVAPGAAVRLAIDMKK